MKEKIFEAHQHLHTPPLNYSDQKVKEVFSERLRVEQDNIHLHYLDNVYISPYAIVFKNFSLVKASVFHMHQANPYTFYKKITLGKVKKINETVILFHHAWFENYYHWWTECLPRLFIIRHLIQDYKVFVPPKLKRFHEDTLALLGINEDNWLQCQEDELIKAKGVLFTDFVSSSFGNHQTVIVQEMKTFFSQFLQNTENSFGKRIYLSREKAPKRKCINETELLHLLKKYDFQTFLPDNLSVREQLGVFSQAECVIGVHGSSFVNALWMPPGSLVIDLIAEQHNDLCYFTWLEIVGVKYLYLIQEHEGVPENYRDNDLKVNIDFLKKMLIKYL